MLVCVGVFENRYVALGGALLLASGGEGAMPQMGQVGLGSLRGVWWVFASMHCLYAGTMAAMVARLSWSGKGGQRPPADP